MRQHFLKRLPEPQGHKSLRPSFSSSSLSPCTMRTPRLTCVSDGKPVRRLLIVSKKGTVVEFGKVHITPPIGQRTEWFEKGDTAASVRFAEIIEKRLRLLPLFLKLRLRFVIRILVFIDNSANRSIFGIHITSIHPFVFGNGFISLF